MEEEELKDIFSKYGQIKHISIKRKNSKFGFIEFQEGREAESALKEDGQEYNGVRIRVERSNPR